VAVLDFGVLPDGRAYLVMEWVGHPTLEEVMTAGPMAWPRAATIAKRVGDALSAAHVRGVVHRDLKPSNVFLGPGDQVKIADFGAAKVLRESGDEVEGFDDVAVGTPLYMAPEQIRGHTTDEATDVYALGCILHQMLSGAPPFVGASVEDTLMKHLREDPPLIDASRGEVPATLQALVTRCLSKAPEARYGTAGSVSEALSRLIAAHRRATSS
jgi:serine/threonine-protein kinase